RGACGFAEVGYAKSGPRARTPCVARACDVACAGATRKPATAAAASVPSTTERRDTRSCVSAEGAESGLMGARMRFVPVLPEFIIQMEVPRLGIFRGFVALLQAGIRLSAPRGSRSRRISHGESRLQGDVR